LSGPFASCTHNRYHRITMKQVDVNLGERSYVVTVGSGALDKLGEVVARVRRPTKALVVSNPVVARHYLERAISSLRAAGIDADGVLCPAGERFKTLRTVSRIYGDLIERKTDRGGILVALGGGVIGDLVGFAAATYMRGIDFYQVPTTLLAQVDASVGGKTGVDLPQGKNLVGAFYQPKAVIIDTATLLTLPARELRCGLAEVVKYGIIYDQYYFHQLEVCAGRLLSRDLKVLEDVIARSVEIKRDVVEQDERELGLRAILNYGHTVGHAIEVLCGYGKYRHGEVVSIGMVTEALLAQREGIADNGIVRRIVDVLIQMRLPVKIGDTMTTAAILEAVERDKKTLGGTLRLALPSRIGECRVHNVARAALAAAIEAHKAWKL